MAHLSVTTSTTVTAVASTTARLFCQEEKRLRTLILYQTTGNDWQRCPLVEITVVGTCTLRHLLSIVDGAVQQRMSRGHYHYHCHHQDRAALVAH